VFTITLKRSLVTLVAVAGLLAAAGAAGAARTDGATVAPTTEVDSLAIDMGTVERLRERQPLLDVMTLPLTAPLGSTKGSFMSGGSELLTGACRDYTDEPLAVNNHRVVVESDSVPQPRSCKWDVSDLDA
jgi:hypothetical protein